MRENQSKPTSSTGIFATIAFMALSVLMFPVTLVGYVIWIGKGILLSNKSGISSTAQGPLSSRYAQHKMGMRQDEAANKLMPLLPTVPPLGLRLATGPTLLAHRLTGYVPKAFRYPFEGEVGEVAEASARQTFLDAVVERYLPDLTQFVILGAGFDTRAYRLPPGTKVRSFELDTPKTQAVKRDMLARAAIDASHVTFVSADFEKDNWLARLVDSGFDPATPALFLWEGVTMYLDQSAVEDTLRKIASTAKGSVIAFDYFTSEATTSQKPYWRLARYSTKAAGEPLKFGVDSTPPSKERLAELLQSCGLSLDEHRTLGKDTETNRAWGGFATAVVR
jgi:methyltransferase (TIGR00027 family)